MKVRVYRKSGDKEYPEIIVDELCINESIGKQKGLTFLYDNLDKSIYEMNVRYDKILHPNDVVFIDDSSIGESFYARITSINIDVSRDDSALMINQNITIERYLDE